MKGTAFFLELYTHYIQGIRASGLFSMVPNPPSILFNPEFTRGANKSYFRFSVKIINSGNAPIINPQLILKLKGDFEDFEDENFDVYFIPQQIESDISCDKRKNEITLSPRRSSLALKEKYTSNLICIKPKNISKSIVTINWIFISNRLTKEGELTLTINSELIRKDLKTFVDFPDEVKTERQIQDYYENME